MSNSQTHPRRSAQADPERGPGQKDRPGPIAPRGRLVLIILALVVVAVVAFLVLRGGQPTESDQAGAQLEHVHGLGVDPADDTLYAGTHYGLFRLPEQADGTRVADRVQDFMGFTVVGPNHFLASGHPGEGQDGPSSLGLIESTDGGRTWESLSLSGEADFHALKARHGLVYGFNSLTSTFMVSQDKRTWDERGQLPMADFAVSPKSPDVVLATTERGLVRSDDGGRSFQLVRNAPVLLLVSWADDGAIAGVAPDGTVYASGGEATSWDRRGTLENPPEALAVANRDEVFAAAGGAVLASSDGGRTFTVRYSD